MAWFKYGRLFWTNPSKLHSTQQIDKSFEVETIVICMRDLEYSFDEEFIEIEAEIQSDWNNL